MKTLRRKHGYMGFQNEEIYDKYGITYQQYNRMLEDQDYSCKICGEVDADGRRLAVDHDHNTGRIRGLLCSRCNTGLGLFDDSIDNLIEAAMYLAGVPIGYLFDNEQQVEEVEWIDKGMTRFTLDT